MESDVHHVEMMDAEKIFGVTIRCGLLFLSKPIESKLFQRFQALS